MHKVKNKLEVNCATVTQNSESLIMPALLISEQISQNIDSDEDDNVLFEKWCAPAGFSLKSPLETLKKMHKL